MKAKENTDAPNADGEVEGTDLKAGEKKRRTLDTLDSGGQGVDIEPRAQPDVSNTPDGHGQNEQNGQKKKKKPKKIAEQREEDNQEAEPEDNEENKEVPNGDAEVQRTDLKVGKKKKRKAFDTLDSGGQGVDIEPRAQPEINDTPDGHRQNEQNGQKKKKKPKKIAEQREEDNQEAEPEDNEENKEAPNADGKVEGTDLKVGKKKKRKTLDTLDSGEQGVDMEPQAQPDFGQKKRKPKKIEERQEEDNQEAEPEDPQEKPRKARDKKKATPADLEAAPNRKKKAEQNTGDAQGDGEAVTPGAEPAGETCLKVCAANLPYWFDKTRIWRYFRHAGEVRHVWVLRESGESRGIAFVTFADRAAVKEALEYDGTSLWGNVIRVNLALDKDGPDSDAADVTDVRKGWGKGWSGGGSWAGQMTDRPAEGKAKGKGKSKGTAPALALADRPQGSLGLMARGLSFDATEEDLKKAFADCGVAPTRIRVLVDKATGKSKGKAFIDFADESSLAKAAGLNGTMLKGRSLRLEFSRAAQ
ncbi:unnamed protein product [Effrenium voratum]|nr:unnamed protein product [Effrenium voratum]